MFEERDRPFAAQTPAAFLSYVHFDDDHERGKITEFRKRLSAEVRMQTGEEFPIFQDKDMEWGDNWRRRIKESLDTSTLFIPIITPGFFKSEPCLDELECFLDREKELGADNLVFPVYYVECPLLSMKEFGSTRRDKLAEGIASRQWFDWRELRFDPLTSSVVSRRLADMAGYVRRALESRETTAKPPKAAEPKLGLVTGLAASSGAGTAAMPAREPVSEFTETPVRAISKTEPPTRVVDPLHRGDYATITAAIQAANPGDRILVRSGLYDEGIVIDKPLEVIGDAASGEVVIRAAGKNVVAFKTSMGRIANLALRQLGGGKWYCVDIAQGRLEIDDCDITSEGIACVGVHGGADPWLRSNRIHGSKQGSGVYVYDNSQGTFEENDIFANAFSGIAVARGANPSFRRNRIHDGKQVGVYVYENGQGVFEDNEIFGNTFSGVQVETGGNPVCVATGSMMVNPLESL